MSIYKDNLESHLTSEVCLSWSNSTSLSYGLMKGLQPSSDDCLTVGVYLIRPKLRAMLNETRWARLINGRSQSLCLYGKKGFKQSIHNIRPQSLITGKA